MVHDITHVLRPGGLVEYFQSDLHAYDEKFQRVEVDMNRIGAPWWPIWNAYMVASVRARGIDTFVGEKTEEWVRETGEYETVVSNDVWLPVVPGPNPLHDEFVCENMRVDIMVSAVTLALFSVCSYRPALTRTSAAVVLTLHETNVTR